MDAVTIAAAAAQSVAATSSVVATASGSAAATGIPEQVASVVATVIPSIAASALPSGLTTTTPITASTVLIPPSLEVASAFAGALAGGLVGVRRQLDAVGVATLAVAAGLGGGIIRDVLLQDYGVYALENPRLLVAALVAAAIAFFFYAAANRVRPVLFAVDAIALGLFACIGTDKALLADLSWVAAILIGTITAVGGGVIRDLLTDEVPQVLRPGGLYATAAVVGALTYVGLVSWLNIVKAAATIAVVLLVLGLRLLSQWLGWQSPMPTDLTPLVAAAPGKALRTGGRAVGCMSRRFGAPAEPRVPSDGEDASVPDDGSGEAQGDVDCRDGS